MKYLFLSAENLGYPTSKNEPKWTYIPFSPLPKIANCGEVCASQLVPLLHKTRKDDDDDDDLQGRFYPSTKIIFIAVCLYVRVYVWQWCSE